MVDIKNKKETMQERVYKELRYSLMVGIFIPGQSISLRKIAQSMETSLMPVREAVNRLIAERAFSMLSNRSVIIPPMTKEIFSQVVSLRKTLEGQAAQEAFPNFNASELKKLNKINDELTAAVEGNQLEMTLIKNREFHFSIYKLSGNSVILPMIESLWLQSGPFTFYSFSSPQIVWNGKNHLRAIDAVTNGTPTELSSAIENDIQHASEFLLTSRFLEPQKLKPLK